MIKTKLLVPAVALFALAGCQTNGDMYRSDVYGSNQVNQAQQVQTVEIIAIQPYNVRPSVYDHFVVWLNCF